MQAIHPSIHPSIHLAIRPRYRRWKRPGRARGGEMNGLMLVTGALLGGAAGWWLATQRALYRLDRVRSRLMKEIRQGQEAAERARAEVARLAREAETWQAGCKQGREDVISIMPLLIATQQRPTEPGPGAQAGGCG